MERFIFALISVAICLYSEENSDLYELGIRLAGLRFSSSSEIGASDFQGLEIDMDLPDRDEFAILMDPCFGEKITKNLVEEIKRKTITFLQEREFPIVAVLLPEQDISYGTLSFLVLIGKLGKVQSIGAYYFSNEKIESSIRTQPGEMIRSDQMMSDLNWINQNPFYTTSLIYQPGEQFGTTDIVLKTKDRFPLRIYSGYENTGTTTVGANRFLAGVNWGNVFDLGHQLNYLFLFDTPLKEWWAQVGSYLIPLPWRHLFKAYASLTRIKTNVESSFQSSGRGWVLGGRYTIPFFISEMKNEIFLGYEFKRTNNFLSFNIETLFDKYVDVSQFLLGYNGRWEYKTGISSLELTLFMSPGNMTAFNKTSIYEEERPGAKSQYVYGKLEFDQILRLPRDCTWVLNNVYQLSSTKLLPSEEFAIGGFYTIRGYDEYELIGDNGILLKNEIRSSPLRLPAPRRLKHELQFLAFVDMGYAGQIDQAIFSNSRAFLASAGPGLRYNFDEYLMARLDFGVQLHHIQRLQEETGHWGRLHMGFTASY